MIPYWLADDGEGGQYAYIETLADWKAYKASGLVIDYHLTLSAQRAVQAAAGRAVAGWHAEERLALLAVLLTDKALFARYQSARRERKTAGHDKSINRRLVAAFRLWAKTEADPTVAGFFASLPKAKVKGHKGWRRFEGVAISPSRRNAMRLVLDAEDADKADAAAVLAMFP